MNFSIFRTSNDNYYLLSRFQKTLINIDKTFYDYILEEKYKNNTLKSDNDFNAKFYNYLENNYFFKRVDYGKRFKLELSSEEVLHTISNTMQITFEVTQDCNLKCKYCGYGEFYGNYGHRTGQYMTFEKAKMMLDYMVNHLNSDYNQGIGPIEINFYGGEPLLNFVLIKKIVEYSKTIKLKKNHFRYGMTTNAILLSKHIDFLALHNFNLLVSLDGNKRNNSYRVNQSGRESFELVNQNIREARLKHPKYFDESISFNSVLHDKNSVEEIYDYFSEQYGKKPNISEINSNGISPDKHDEYEKIFNTVRSSLEKSNRRRIIQQEMFDRMPDITGSLNFIQTYHNNTFLSYNELFVSNPNSIINLTGTCLPFSRKVFISTSGKILPCESVGQDFELGYVDENGVHIDFTAVANFYNSVYYRYVNLCIACEHKGECLECLMTSSKRDKATKCKQFATKKEFEMYCTFRMSFLENNAKCINKLNKIVLK